MKKLGIAIVILLFIGGVLFATAMYIISNITYTYYLSGLNIWNISFTKDTIVRVQITLNIGNNNTFNIPIKYLHYEVYYQGGLIAKSSDAEVNKQPIIILGNTQNQKFKQSIEVHLNNNAIKLASNIFAKKDTDYKIKLYANIFGITLPLKNIDYTYKQT